MHMTPTGSTRGVLRALCCFLVLGSGIAAAQTPPPARAAEARQQPTERVLVIPFENPTKEARLYWIKEASAVLIADDLNAFGARAYTREERLDAFQRLQVPPIASLSHATVIRLGQVVGASHVVIGSFRLTGGMISVRTQKIRLDTGRMEHEFVEAGPLDNLFEIFGRVSRRLAGQSASSLLPPRPSLPVFENYIKGLIAASPPAKVGYLEAAIKLDPGFDRARLALWNVHHEDTNGQVALVAAAAVPETSPMYARARFSVALSLIQLNRLDDAFATLRTLADRTPSATLMNNIGVIQLRRPVTPQTGRATYYFNQALKLDEDDQDYYFNLGYAYWAEKDTASAIFWLREAVRRNPADGEAHAVLSAALQATGASAEAARERELATQLSSTYAEWAKRPATPGGEAIPRGLERLKPSLEASTLHRIDSAIAITGQREQKELATFHLDRGRRLFEQGSNTEAVTELSRAIYLSPYEAAAHLLLGRIYLRTGDTAAAIDAFKIALWSEESVEGRIALAHAHIQAKDTAAARAALERALALDANSSEAKELLGKLAP
jgi:tetratricopeptide (TPR) repeat protein